MQVVGKWVRTLGIGAVVFLLFAVVVGIAGAQRPDAGQPGPAQGQDGGPGAARGELRDQYISHLAANLGLPEATVRDALAKTREEMRPLMQERLQQARERFRERAQDPDFRERLGQLRERLEERFRGGEEPGPSGGPGFFRGGAPSVGPAGRPGGPGMLLQASAEILNVAPDALRGELEQGKTLAQVAQEHGVQPSAFGDQLATRLEQQRDQNLRAMIERIINQPFPAPGQRLAPGGSQS